jgi:transcriptional regulator with XRE-family HTH domain
MEDINKLRDVLSEKRVTSRWLANKLGVTPSTVSKWCTNSSQPSLETLIRISDVLEVDYTELIRAERRIEK